MVILAVAKMYEEKLKSFWGTISIISILCIGLHLIEADRGILFASLGLSVLSSSYLIDHWSFHGLFKNIRIKFPRNIRAGVLFSWLVLILMISFHLVYPIKTPYLNPQLKLSGQEKESLVWLRENTEEDAMVMSGPSHWVTGIAHRESYFDGYYRGKVNSTERYRNVEAAFASDPQHFWDGVSKVDYLLIIKDTSLFSIDTSLHDRYLEKVFENEDAVIYRVPSQYRGKEELPATE